MSDLQLAYFWILYLLTLEVSSIIYLMGDFKERSSVKCIFGVIALVMLVVPMVIFLVITVMGAFGYWG